MSSSAGKKSTSLIHVVVIFAYSLFFIVCVISRINAGSELEEVKKKLREATAASENTGGLESAVAAAQSDYGTAVFAFLIVGFVCVTIIISMVVTWCCSKQGFSVDVQRNWFEVLLPILFFFIAMAVYVLLGQFLSDDIISRMAVTTAYNLLPIILIASIWKAGTAAFLAWSYSKQEEKKSELEPNGDKVDQLLEKIGSLENQISELQDSSEKHACCLHISGLGKILQRVLMR